MMQRSSSSASSRVIFRPRSIVERLQLADLFAVQQPVEVELGSGDGGFVVQQAKARPDHNFIAVERLLGRLRKIDRKAQRAQLTNLRAIRLEASYVVQYLLPADSVCAMHIYFPDPWPKRRHHKNRLINTRFTDLTKAALEPNGFVYLRTDDRPYFEQMTSVFNANPAFAQVETPESLAFILTDFERHFLAQGISTLRAAYQRVG